MLYIAGCNHSDTTPVDKRIKQFNPQQTSAWAREVEAAIKPELDSGLKMKVWATDSLISSPVAIDVDDSGQVYYVTPGRQQHSEFDIRAHKDWETASNALQTVEDRRAFLHKTLSPENSKNNPWLYDVNGDSSRDWRDLAIETEKVYRLQDVNGDGVADLSQLAVDDFHEEVTDVAGGVMKEGEDLYVAVAPDLWRMRDKNGDGVADEKTSLSHGYGVHIGFSGHGMSGIEMGPDGRIYWQIGDIGFNGVGPDGEKFEYPNSGVIARANPDGSDFEIFASGNRNTHEFVFDEYGNLISEDNDGDHAGEKERLVYIVDGADIGWRSNWQYGKYTDPNNNTYKVWMDEKMHVPRFEGQAAYITPCISNFVNGPAGMAYNPGTALGPEYNRTFFIVEFVGSPSRSGIHAFHLSPKGATFTLAGTKKIVGDLLPTGIEFGPDGALYVADWVDGWDAKKNARIWRLDTKDQSYLSLRNEVKTLLMADFKKRSVTELEALLTNADMRVREKTQFELARRGKEGEAAFQHTLTTSTNQLARIHAIWGLNQLCRKKISSGAALFVAAKGSDAEIRAQAAKCLADVKTDGVGDLLIALLKDTSSRVRFFAAQSLGRIKYAPAIQPLIDFLAANNDEDAYLRHAGSLALARIGQAEPVVALSTHPSQAVRIAAVVALRRMRSPGIARFLNDKDEFVVTEAARAINDDLSIAPALPALGNLLATTSFQNEALIRRSINANLRIGTTEALNVVIKYAAKPDAPPALRAEAIETIFVWANPSVLDRVDGRYRGVIHRNADSVRTQAADIILSLLRSKDVPVKLAATKAIARLQLRVASAGLLVEVKSAKQPELRSEALKALVALKAEQVPAAISLAIADRDKSVRVTGLELLTSSNISSKLMVQLLSRVIANQATEEKQAAILTLGKLPLQIAEAPLAGFVKKLEEKKLSPDLYLELGEAIDSTGSEALRARYASALAKLSPNELTVSYSSSLTGGDRQKGVEIFFSNQAAQCVRCHAYGDHGGNVGPQLQGIGARITRTQILEALIAPSARLSPGFGMVTLQLKDGQKVTGTLENENAASIIIKVGNDPVKTIFKKDLVNRTNYPSAMPDMKQFLSKREIRDVVSFLAASKGN